MSLQKFCYRLRAQNGALIEQVVIQAADEPAARDKLLRMYPHGEVLVVWTEAAPTGGATGRSFEDIADLLND